MKKMILLTFLLSTSLFAAETEKRRLYFRCELDRSFGDFRDFKEEFFFEYPFKSETITQKSQLRFFEWELQVSKNGKVILEVTDAANITDKKSLSMTGLIPTNYEQYELVLEGKIPDSTNKQVKLTCAPEKKKK